ncbi:MAG: MBL fold metallo-hydrolase [Candidatus Dormibacteraceae bacterium]
MHLGDFEVHTLVASRWKPDGGMMFGVIPKVLWGRWKPADERNLIEASCVAVVVRHRGRVFVCETGIGTKLDEKRARQSDLREPDGLLASLARLGIRPDEVDVVLTTHLHWDHAGGLTRQAPGGAVELTFPRAKHFIQRAEWDYALAPDVRSDPAFIRDDFVPVADAGLVEFLDGDAEVLPGVEMRATGGHTPGHQVAIFRPGEGDLACVVTGDLVPMAPHLRVSWNLAADLDVSRVMREKARLFDEAARHRWLLVLSHEAETPAGYRAADGTWTAEDRLAPV